MKLYYWPLVLLCVLFLIGVSGSTESAQAVGQQGIEAVAAASTPMPNRYFLPIVYKPTPPKFPLTSPSYYMTSMDSQKIYDKGCALGKRDLNLVGKQDSVVVLAFGYTQYNAKGDGLYGANTYTYPRKPANTNDIAAAVENFGLGYWSCVGADFDSHLRIAVGTSNYSVPVSSSVTYNHGKAWAQMVNKINDWFVNTCKNSCDGQVDAVGANDIELSWGAPDETINWLNGYASSAKYPMYNFGALEGCPWLKNSGANCYWKDKEKVWFAIWGSPPVQPVPEIYRDDGINAEQWYLMSAYSYNYHGEKIHFVGPMTELRACQQVGGCNLSDGTTIANTPENAWKQLIGLLNGDSRTNGETLPYSTDIQW